jgi:hypothetical protein
MTTRFNQFKKICVFVPHVKKSIAVVRKELVLNAIMMVVSKHLSDAVMYRPVEFMIVYVLSANITGQVWVKIVTTIGFPKKGIAYFTMYRA